MTPAQFAMKYRIKGVKFDHLTGRFVKFNSIPKVGAQLTNPEARIRIECPNAELLNFVVMLMPFTECLFVYGVTTFQWSHDDGYAFYFTRNHNGDEIFGDICRAQNIPAIRTEDERRNSYEYLGTDSDSPFDGDYREGDNERDDDRARF